MSRASPKVDGRLAQVALLLGALTLVSACDPGRGQATKAAEDAPVQVHVAHLSVGPITRSIILPAQVIPFQQATLYAKVSGYLKTITVDKGDRVTSGAVLSTLWLGPDTYQLDSIAFSASPVDLFPNGFTSSALTVTLWARGYSRQVTMSRAGWVRVL